jgi:hypothetical protein
MWLRSQKPLHVQGDSGPGKQGSGPKKNNRKKRRAKEEERHKGPLTQKARWSKSSAEAENIRKASFLLEGNHPVCTLIFSSEAAQPREQGDQTGRIFAYWAFLIFEHFFET